MNNFDITTLKNGIRVITRQNKSTPRTALNMFYDSGIKCESKAGIASLSGRLLLQGTKTRSQEQIAEELDSNAIELHADTKQDYTKLKGIFLNEDLDKELDILEDLVKNSTFESFEKESKKFKGEIEVDLDSPRTKAVDNLIKNIYPNNPYGNSHTRVLEDLSEITESQVKDYYSSSLAPERMNIVVIGDIDRGSIRDKLESRFGNIQGVGKCVYDFGEVTIPENKIVTISKDDAAQAQIVQGWIAPTISDPDYAALAVLNTVLGSSGLSSRLFVELRDKKGLAYTVRSSYDPMKFSGNFSIYIATAPVNINTSIEGFGIEIKKLQDELVSEKELNDAKSNILGKRAFFHETNSQQAHYLGYYDIIGLGADYDNKVAEKIKAVTAENIRDVANKYLSGTSVISILAPDEYLKTFK